MQWFPQHKNCTKQSPWQCISTARDAKILVFIMRFVSYEYFVAIINSSLYKPPISKLATLFLLSADFKFRWICKGGMPSLVLKFAMLWSCYTLLVASIVPCSFEDFHRYLAGPNKLDLYVLLLIHFGQTLWYQTTQDLFSKYFLTMLINCSNQWRI